MKRVVLIVSLGSLLCAMEKLVILYELESSSHPLIGAAQNGETETLKMLLSETVDPNTFDQETGLTALHQAVLKNQEKAVEVLLACDFHESLTHGANPNTATKNGITPLMAASYTGNRAIAGKLLNYGAKTEDQTNNPHGLTALHIATIRNHDTLVELLLNAGEDKNSQDTMGGTPLMIAAQMGHMKIIRLLCEGKASTSIVDKKGRTALHHACLYAQDERAFTMVLLNYDPLGRQDNEGATALHYAAETNKLIVATAMIKLDHPLNITTIHTQTALYLACAKGYNELVKLLLDAKADHTIADDRGNTPYAIALENNHNLVTQEFKERNLA